MHVIWSGDDPEHRPETREGWVRQHWWQFLSALLAGLVIVGLWWFYGGK